jgi:hypothetical protein
MIPRNKTNYKLKKTKKKERKKKRISKITMIDLINYLMKNKMNWQKLENKEIIIDI